MHLLANKAAASMCLADWLMSDDTVRLNPRKTVFKSYHMIRALVLLHGIEALIEALHCSPNAFASSA